ncbi:MAG: glycosyltransferase family 2 protein [Candidatus Marinimicrobia bacterium]|nr:glycosyltransferase family 2 protein [Candidatus Neomarinimicrobiota bacterium]
MKGLILISAYNSATTLPDVLQELKMFPELEIVVINDGSNDNTGEIAHSFGAQVIDHKFNKGKGAALQTGFRYAVKKDVNFIITLDADKQHPIEQIPEFIEKHKKYPNDVILGRRKRDKNMPWIRKFSNSVSASLISWRIRQRIYDAQCGFRLIPRLYLSWDLSSINGFIFESETLITLAMNGVKFKFISIPTIYPEHSHSRMTYFDSTIGFISMYIVSFFKSYKQEKHGL